MTPRLPDNFIWHVTGVLAFFFLGLSVMILQCYAAAPCPAPLNATELQTYYTNHVHVVMPFLDGAFYRIIFLNGGVSLFIVCVPMFWVWVWWFQRDWLEPLVVIMKGTVLLLMMALGHNSFARIYTWYRTLPPDIFWTLLYPHGIPELLAFFIAGVFSLTCIDALHNYLANQIPEDLHPGDIGLFIFSRIWPGLLCILALIILAAWIESQVTPQLVKTMIESQILKNGMTVPALQ